ncbi:two-component regulator propeller domain-containing protein [Candidatus Poribacteria bacterium]
MDLRKTFIIGLCVGVVLLASGLCSVMAVTPTVWEQSSQKDFDAGKPKDVSITSTDEVLLSRELLPIDGDKSELRIWCLAQDSQGNVYAGTGDKGKIFKITGEGEMSLLFDSPETDIFSLVVDGDDNIYAGTAPDGLIYKISPGRVAETFFSTGEKYVWALVFDKAGNLYAGTGMTGKLYKISPDGKGEVVYDSNDAHIKCVLSSGDNIYAGTEGEGIIYKISSDGKVFALYDTSEREISCLAVDANGNLYAGAASGEPKAGRDDPGRPGPPGLDREREERKSYVYQITPDEVVTRIWSSPDPLIFSIIANGENMIVGTGGEGKVYSVTPDGDWSPVADCEESQVLALHKMKDSGEIWLATGNAGKLYKLSSSYLKEGTLKSQERDASITSSWGMISWDAIPGAGTSITMATRSGNTKKPDDTWSEWSDEYTESAGEAITSPPARFIKWRAKLASEDGAATPVLKRVSIAYLQRNLKPSVRSVTVAAEKQGNEGPPRVPQGRGDEEGKGNPEKVPFRGKKAIKWQARDPNSDSLEYSVYFRGAEEKNWKLLEEELRGTSLPLNTGSFPDGTYFIRIVAIDSPSNPTETALSDEKVSDPFDIDNTAPTVTGLKTSSAGAGRYVVTGEAKDAGSYIKGVVYSIDADNWRPIFPADKIFDSRAEIFSFPTDALKSGEHTVVIRVSDAAGNIGTAKTIISAE